MEQVITTEMFNGQYWVIIVERIKSDGKIFTAKHTLGSEATFGDLVNFYNNIYPNLVFLETNEVYRFKKNFKHKELKRMENRSFDIYLQAQKIFLENRKQRKREIKAQEGRVKFQIRQEKKKKKKRGK